MYRTSEEQIFARIEVIRHRAARLVHGDAAGPPPPDEDAMREAAALAARVELRLPQLTATFELDPLAADALMCLVAAEYDPFLRTLMRAVQRESGRPWLEIGTIAELLDLPTPRVSELARLFAPTGTLRKWALVIADESGGPETPAVAMRVKVAARIAQFLVGDDTLPDGMSLRAEHFVLGDSLVPTALAQGLLGRVRRALLAGSPLALEVCGSPGTGRRFFLEGLAAELGLPALVVDLGAVDRPRLDERLREARREARLMNALLVLANWDVHLPSSQQQPMGDDNTPPPASTQPRRLPSPFVAFFAENDRAVAVTAEEREPLLEQHAHAIAHVAVPFPTPSQRAALLARALERLGTRAADDVDLTAMARRFALDPGRIEVAARGAIELALEREPEVTTVGPISRNDLNEACRHQLRHDLKSLAVRVTNSHKWEDLVIPVDVYYALREMIAYLKHAQKVYDEWGFGSRHSLGQGVSALFAGPPGTGKTMCASVIARELDMELFRVDLSRVVSKWIGETEKNLGKVFDEAQRSNAIILFDEADSLFAKRTEVKSSVDRYANLEVNFLLQRMEAFSGVTILTTNFEDTIDTAFKRRLTFKMHFEKPDAEARAALWRKVFPSSAALAADVDPARLGELFEMSGGNIRNAAVRAAFLAAAEDKPIDMATILLAAERESREMGLLTRSAAPPPAEPGAAPDAEAEPEPEPEKKPRRSHIIPVSHPRR